MGLHDIDIRRTHKEFGTNWELQYENWATPEAIVDLLSQMQSSVESERENETRNPSPTAMNMLSGTRLLENLMFLSKPGQNRLKGLLPETARIAHKTGTGGTRDGITSATNDVGIITLPNGKHIAIAVFVGDSRADEKTREAVIARMAKAAWDTWNK
jgi:beta-lactamase class A